MPGDGFQASVGGAIFMTDKRDEAQLLYCCAMHAMLSIYDARDADGVLAEAIESKVFYLPISVFARLFFDAETAEASSEALFIEDVRSLIPGDVWRTTALALREAFEARIIAAMRDPERRQLHLALHEIVRGCAPRRLAGLVRYIGESGRFAGVARGDLGSVMNISDDGVYEVSFAYDEEPFRSEDAVIPGDLLEQVDQSHLIARSPG